MGWVLAEAIPAGHDTPEVVASQTRQKEAPLLSALGAPRWDLLFLGVEVLNRENGPKERTFSEHGWLSPAGSTDSLNWEFGGHSAGNNENVCMRVYVYIHVCIYTYVYIYIYIYLFIHNACCCYVQFQEAVPLRIHQLKMDIHKPHYHIDRYMSTCLVVGSKLGRLRPAPWRNRIEQVCQSEQVKQDTNIEVVQAGANAQLVCL